MEVATVGRNQVAPRVREVQVDPGTGAVCRPEEEGRSSTALASTVPAADALSAHALPDTPGVLRRAVHGTI